MLDITAAQRRSLRARAHALKPVVSISQKGLTESVMKEIGVCLDSHELIKIRVYSDEREEREKFLSEICEHQGAAPVQHIGKLLVIWRPSPEQPIAKESLRASRRHEPRRTKRSHQG